MWLRPAPLERWLAASGVLSATVLVIAVNVLVTRFYARWDLTSRQIYSLSAPTVETLHGLAEPIEIVVFLGRNDPLTLSVRHLLAAYGAETRWLRPRYVDPDRSPAEFLALQRRFGLTLGRAEDGSVVADAAIVIARGDARWFLTAEQLVSYDPEDGTTQPRLEQALTEGLRRVLARGRPTVCFSKGHQEARIDDLGPQGLVDLARRLTRANYEVVDVDLTAPRPERQLDDCRVLAIVGPEIPFAAAAARDVVGFVDRGGSVLLAASALRDHEYRPVASGLAALAERAGVELGADTVVERASDARLPDGVGERFFARAEEHPITQGIVSDGAVVYRVLLSVAQSLRPVTAAEPEPSVAPLLRSSEQAFSVEDLRPFLEGRALAPRPRDPRGPLLLGVAAELPRGVNGARTRSARLVVLGTASVALAASYRDPALRGNQRLVEGAIAWLAAEPALVDVPAKPGLELGAQLTESSLREVARYVLLYMPATAALLGLLVLLRRRAGERRGRREPRSEAGGER